MNQAKFFIALTFLLAFALQVSAQKSRNKKITLTIKDKSEIVQTVFSNGVKNLMNSIDSSGKLNAACLIPIINEQKVVFLLKKNIENLVTPQIEEYQVRMFSNDELKIQSRQGNQCHFEFDFLEIQKNKVSLNFWRKLNSRTGLYGDVVYLGGIAAQEGLRYELVKQKGEWKIKDFSKL